MNNLLPQRKQIVLLSLCASLFGYTAVASAEVEDNGSRSGSSPKAPDMLVSVAAGDQSAFRGASSENFDSLSPGIHNNVGWDGVGSVDRLNLTHSGAGNYSELSGADRGVQQAVLTLDQKSSYFGFDLVSAKKGGFVDFYNGASHVGSLSISDLGVDSGFIHFTGDANTSWDKIVFSNGEDKGFDTKNWTSRVEGWNPNLDGVMPGTVKIEIKNGTASTYVKSSSNFAPASPGAPAPPVAACLAFAGVLLLQALRRGKAVVQQ